MQCYVTYNEGNQGELHNHHTIVLVGTSGQTINPKPENTHVMVGDDATIRCTIQDISNGQLWYNVIDGVANGLSFDGTITANQAAGKYGIEGTYNLHIVDSTLSDAATYRCEYFSDASIHFESQLVVLGMT